MSSSEKWYGKNEWVCFILFLSVLVVGSTRFNFCRCCCFCVVVFLFVVFSVSIVVCTTVKKTAKGSLQMFLYYFGFGLKTVQ